MGLPETCTDMPRCLELRQMDAAVTIVGYDGTLTAGGSTPSGASMSRAVVISVRLGSRSSVISSSHGGAGRG